jgi:hypothetical protein
MYEKYKAAGRDRRFALTGRWKDASYLARTGYLSIVIGDRHYRAIRGVEAIPRRSL